MSRWNNGYSAKVNARARIGLTANGMRKFSISLCHANPPTPAMTIPAPTSDPVIACVVDTGIRANVAAAAREGGDAFGDIIGSIPECQAENQNEQHQGNGHVTWEKEGGAFFP